ncbi:MAG: hypothetical protein ABI183_15360 [Polyangiaceae bacterium]
MRAIVAKRMDCDEQLVEVVAQPSGSDRIAYYDIHACNKTASYYCTEHNRVVACDDAAKPTTSSDSSSTGDYDTSGCNCGNLFASHRSSPAASPANNSVMPSTQRINNNGR